MIKFVRLFNNNNRFYCKMAANNKVNVVLGTMEFGRNERETEKVSVCHEMVNKFVSYGYNELDTAYMYTDGASETILGKLPKDLKVKIATKANPWNEPWKSLTTESINAQQQESFKRLQTDNVDLFYLHSPDHNTDLLESLTAINELYKQKKFQRFGVSNYSSKEVEEIWQLCEKHNFVKPVVYQGMYNALTRQVEDDLFDVLRKYNISFYAFNPLAGGVLTGRYVNMNAEEKSSRFFGNSWAELYKKRFWRPEVFDAMKKVMDVLPKDVTITDAALLWLKYHSKLTDNDAIIIGASRMAHLDLNLSSLNKSPLPQQVVDAFDQGWELTRENCPSYAR